MLLQDKETESMIEINDLMALIYPLNDTAPSCWVDENYQNA
ncbi:hypothetical protein [Dulcicalothrix desertica]|nr:hypothetical protein [Dulcicalothrix desertica]TWH42492.1 hypothetical protein CAL7102_06154 [Dulcicalothrix desertica PCC 7102]